jgi:pseudouridine synthase
MEERLQKLMARAGIGSRRSCEDLIRQGRVIVNGKVAQLGQKGDPSRDRIEVDGERLQIELKRTYVALNKPQGVLSAAKDDERRYKTVRDLVRLPGHLFPVGRLDLMSEGLILLTDDGEIANLLTHPRYEHTKEYQVRLTGDPDEDKLERWRRGVVLDGRMTAPADVSLLRRERSGTWLRVVLREGRNRQIRRVAEILGYPVQRVIRIRIGPIELGSLNPGEWRHLTDREVKQMERLKKQAGRKA